jgi:alpha-N-acetylglucosaminidase
MTRIQYPLRLLILLLFIGGPVSSSYTKPETGGVLAARHVLERALGKQAASFRLSLMPARDTVETFEVSAAGGVVSIRGTSPVALVRGAYQYLRTAGHGMICWSGSNVRLPGRLPEMPRTVVQSPYKYRQYFNICAFGYSTVWWDWTRWEREIDWMALHGINMPLAMVGQTSVWQRVWESFGIPRDSLQSFFVGPAFLPWHWMGNIDRHEGPLPQSWIDSQELLQKKILNRLKELGMTPIVPTFSGFVPEAFQRRFPVERVSEHRHWSSLPDSDRTFALVPGSPMFQEIGKRFIEEYRRTFGPAKYYLADSFNELDVPVTPEHRYEELAAYGDAVFQSIHRADPDGVWVMQGWIFFNAASFWDSLSTQALLSRVPDKQMMIVDMANEQFHGWKVQHGFYGKQWIYSTIHNFGGNTQLRGDLKVYASDPPTPLKSPERGNLVGYGLSPEGVENNEVVYELLSDMAWKTEPADLHAWLHDYCVSRYGSVTPGVERAWLLLNEAVYSGVIKHHTVFAFQHRPAIPPRREAFYDGRIEEALNLMLKDAKLLRGSKLFTNDLIDVAVYAIGNRIDTTLADACRAHESSDPAKRDSLAWYADTMIRQLDGIVNTRPDLRLERWIGMAKAEGQSEFEKKLYERNARKQITVWGGPDLHEYASKVWSGLIRDFYAERWRQFFKLLRDGSTSAEAQERVRLWDEEWGSQTGLSSPESVKDVLSAIQAITGSRKTEARVEH